MRWVAVSQRVVIDPATATRYDGLDQRWWAFLGFCGLGAVPVPNEPDGAVRLIERTAVSGVLLTGGNDLIECGGDAPERDATEHALLDHAGERHLPVLAVCRGMQLLLRRFGARLREVPGHVAAHQVITVDGQDRPVNSYHHWAATSVPAPLVATAATVDGVVKAVRHESAPWEGIMWHPERLQPFAEQDRRMFRTRFGGAR